MDLVRLLEAALEQPKSALSLKPQNSDSPPQTDHSLQQLLIFSLWVFVFQYPFILGFKELTVIVKILDLFDLILQYKKILSDLSLWGKIDLRLLEMAHAHNLTDLTTMLHKHIRIFCFQTRRKKSR